MKSFFLLLATFAFVVLLFYALHPTECPEPTVVTAKPEIRIVYVTNKPEPAKEVPANEVPGKEEPAPEDSPDGPAHDDPHHVAVEDWPKRDRPLLPPKPFSGEIPESHKAPQPMAPKEIDDSNKEQLKAPEIVIDNNVPDLGNVLNPEPLPPAEMRALQAHKLQPKEIPEHLPLFSQCVYIMLYRVPDKELFSQFEKAHKYCMDTLQIVDQAIMMYASPDDFRFFVDPVGLGPESPCHVITLGVNRSITIEQEWQNKFQFCSFVGSDPDAANAQIFHSVGKFVLYPTDGNNGTKPGNANTTSPNLAAFLRANAVSPVDAVSVNIKELEYSIWDSFLKNGSLDQVEFVVCQWNVEYNEPDATQKEQFGVQMRKVMKEGRYLPLKYSLLGKSSKIYYVNIEDPQCVQRYVIGRL